MTSIGSTKTIQILSRILPIPATLYRTRWAYQNQLNSKVILLRNDLHDAWDNYKFAVNPDPGHVVIHFIPGYDDIAGKVLKLDHITDGNIRPLDDLFRDQVRLVGSPGKGAISIASIIAGRQSPGEGGKRCR
ncbi:hypothetical protein BJV77DRAFT_240040 [Russula vinacea]|nr:hypothetical protein BJV77DRAFT_240040 [Russula vinacea]